jgi:hypothetical protein
MSLIIKKNTTFKIPRASVAPTTIPFGAATPTLYFSGLVMPDDAEWTGMYYDNPWTFYFFGDYYMSDSGVGIFYHDGIKWEYKARGTYTEYGIQLMRLACTNSSPAGAIPLTGWVNESWCGGSLVISTTP